LRSRMPPPYQLLPALFDATVELAMVMLPREW
jgi:hypothetical protein